MIDLQWSGKTDEISEDSEDPYRKDHREILMLIYYTMEWPPHHC